MLRRARARARALSRARASLLLFFARALSRAVPVAATWLYSQPETMHFIVRKARARRAARRRAPPTRPPVTALSRAVFPQLNYIIYPPETARPPLGEDINAYRPSARADAAPGAPPRAGRWWKLW